MTFAPDCESKLNWFSLRWILYISTIHIENFKIKLQTTYNDDSLSDKLNRSKRGQPKIISQPFSFGEVFLKLGVHSSEFE